MRIKFKIRNRKWKTIHLYTDKKEIIIRLYKFYPFIKIDIYYETI